MGTRISDDAASLDENCPQVVEFERVFKREFPGKLSVDEIVRAVKQWKHQHLSHCHRCQAYAAGQRAK